MVEKLLFSFLIAVGFVFPVKVARTCTDKEVEQVIRLATTKPEKSKGDFVSRFQNEADKFDRQAADLQKKLRALELAMGGSTKDAVSSMKARQKDLRREFTIAQMEANYRYDFLRILKPWGKYTLEHQLATIADLRVRLSDHQTRLKARLARLEKKDFKDPFEKHSLDDDVAFEKLYVQHLQTQISILERFKRK